MRSLLVCVCVVAMTALTAAQGNQSAAGDEAAIRDVVKRYVDARDRRDAAAIAALFTVDADQFTTSGEWRRGREAIVKGGLASSQQNPGARTIDVKTVRVIAPGVAIADGGYAIQGTGRTMWTTIVLARDADSWKIVAIRNAVPTGTR
jgi:uncharacterized protein (TIGR02246 family)